MYTLYVYYYYCIIITLLLMIVYIMYYRLLPKIKLSYLILTTIQKYLEELKDILVCILKS